MTLLEDAIRRLWKAEDDLKAVKGQLRQALRERDQLRQEAAQARAAEAEMERMLLRGLPSD
ncbi:hypothetical protein [Mesorhizobium sp. M7A.F.Ca.MR.362.00.0.0]|uniref:hypothetical protein n=1 Tax=Mesorhizobium sp. M7A.F.Ca.MR.362.00.0.0 TaxID=2496779 RepID=UPI000FD33F50|nr:hypothetical protein [Mesorhizobium sp. M7A.F.Ca.MR.362.00.0.0]RUU80240.1 hypothetical protein EOC06_12975 [Mesorhizobium sp. M7A.F.Ca.MR.362.00.0.0]RWN95143.1 MAG: hypothetical protein EOS05_10105 [Mesorhizobium sp.]